MIQNIIGFQKKSYLPDAELIKYFAFIIRALKMGFSVQDAHSKYRPNNKYKNLFHRITVNLNKGMSFSTAIAKAGLCSNNIAVIIKSGEESARLIDALESLKNSLQEQLKIKKEIKKTLFMPVIELIFGFLAINITLLFIMQKVKGVIIQLGNVPEFSKFLFSVSDFYKANIVFFIIGYIAVAFLSIKNKDKIKWILYKIPVFKEIMQYGFSKNFFFQIYMYLGSGMSLAHALGEMEKLVSDVNEKKFISSVLHGIKKGLSFDDSIRKAPVKLIPDEIVDILSVTKYTGEYLEPIREIVDYSKEEHNTHLGKLASIIEPGVIMFLGVAVFMLIISVYYPIFTISSTYK